MARQIIFLLSWLILSPLNAEPANSKIAALRDMTLEELFDVEVSSLFKRPMKLFDAPAAMHVITSDDIRRSGATSIAEALRLAPGMQVAQVDSNKWAISIRGLQNRFVSHLLILVDGRSVYSPTFGGTYWEVRDYVLEDIERIEIIRGPGGALWGANAANGIVNIVTKAAEDTQGGYLNLIGGTEEQGTGEFRYGIPLGTDGFGRFYVKGVNRDALELNGNDAKDDWYVLRGGFRADWEFDGDRLSVHGDYHGGEFSQEISLPASAFPFYTVNEEDVKNSGGNMMFRWDRIFDEGNDLSLQFYYDYTRHEELSWSETRHTLDADFQHRFLLPFRMEFIYGLNFRYFPDEFENDRVMTFSPSSKDMTLASFFVQDEIELIEEKLRLTLGTKVEYHSLAGVEHMPSARLTWTPSDRQTLWAAVSRAVRTPIRSFHGISMQMFAETPPPVDWIIEWNGNPNLDTDNLMAYEVGCRLKPNERLSLDVAGYYFDYRDIVLFPVVGTDFTVFPSVIYGSAANSDISDEIYGAEVSARCDLTDDWRVHAYYNYVDGVTRFAALGPENQASLRSSHDLPNNLEFDWWLRFVDFIDSQYGTAESYIDLDVRLGWRFGENLEMAVVGQNLIEGSRREFMDDVTIKTPATEAQRAVYFQFTFRF